MTNLNKHIKETQQLLHVMRVQDKSISVQVFDSISQLVQDKVGFQQFQTARNFFEKAFGYEMARVDNYIFLVKKTAKQVIYIEIEVEQP